MLITLRPFTVCVFRCFAFARQGPTQYPTVVAQSNAVSFDNPAAPAGIHLALPVDQQHPGATSSMQVTWTSTSWYVTYICYHMAFHPTHPIQSHKIP